MDQTTTELAVFPDDETLMRFHATVLAATTVTSGLAVWCASRGIGEGEIAIRKLFVALPKTGNGDGTPGMTTATSPPAAPAPPAPAASDLDPTALSYRRVRLIRGTIDLADAEIWYAADRIPRHIQASLASPDIPFGRAVAPLAPYRDTIATRRPLTAAATPQPENGFVLETTARLYAGDGTLLGIARERFPRHIF